MTDILAPRASGAAPAAAGPGPAAPGPTAPTGGGRAVADADFETFLSLLTAQMRNQDPLKPMESTEFVAQLASFSAVEQQITTNERLQSVLDALDGEAGAGLSAWIGLEAETAAALRHDGGPLAFSVSPVAGATEATLRVRAADGRLLGLVPVDPSAERVTWDGRIDGVAAPAGTRSFEIAYSGPGGSLGSRDALRVVRLADLRFGEEGPRFGLAGGGEAAPADLVSLRPPA